MSQAVSSKNLRCVYTTARTLQYFKVCLLPFICGVVACFKSCCCRAMTYSLLERLFVPMALWTTVAGSLPHSGSLPSYMFRNIPNSNSNSYSYSNYFLSIIIHHNYDDVLKPHGQAHPFSPAPAPQSLPIHR